MFKTIYMKEKRFLRRRERESDEKRMTLSLSSGDNLMHISIYVRSYPKKKILSRYLRICIVFSRRIYL